MNTSTVYVEPIFVGCLIGLALGLPFYGDPNGFYHNNSELLQIGPTFLGILIIGVAYLIGIPADRLLDTLMEGLEKHCRIRFVLKKNKDFKKLGDESIQQKIDDGKDPFPENRYRTAALLEAGPAFNDFLQYVRTRVRMSRALAFALPSLTFAGLACRVLTDDALAAHLSATIRCLLKGGVAFAWIFATLLVLLLPVLGKVVSGMCPQWPADRWSPPRTDDVGGIVKYEQARRKPYADLFLDVVLQPFPISSALLLVAAAIVGRCYFGPAGLTAAAVGALLTCAVGYAWWRSTGTFMTYLSIAGPKLERSALDAGRGQ